MSAGERPGPAGNFRERPVRLRFGDCVFDGGTREILRGGKAVHIPLKTFRLLELLLKPAQKRSPRRS